MRPRETLRMALVAIRAHKLRSALTLVGIVAGVASIIGVMTGISVVQATMEHELSVLGTTTFQVQKWPPRGINTDVDWREIQKRRPVTVAQTDAVREAVRSADLVGAEFWRFGSRARYGREETEPNLTVCGGTPEYAPNNTHYVGSGRNLTSEDLRLRRAVVVVGPAVAGALFPFTDPVDKVVKIDGRKFTVVGVFQEKASAMGGGYDNYLLVPVTTFVDAWGARDEGGQERSINMTVNARSPELLEEAIEETRAVLRSVRGVKPGQPDDFYVFTNDSQVKSFNQATRGVKIGAFLIGTIALVVAGVGIMNIMLVSVTERTREIGVRKALGARRRSILLQFLVEAVVLSNLGGAGGVLLGFALGNLVSVFTGFAVNVPWGWAGNGLLFCTAVGIGFGMWPALRASRLSPVVAFSYE